MSTTTSLADEATRLAEQYLTGRATQRAVDKFLAATRDDDRVEGTHLGLWRVLVTAVGNRDLYRLGELSAVAACGHGNPDIADRCVDEAVAAAAARFAGDA